MGWLILVLVAVIAAAGLFYERTLHGQARALESFIKGMSLPLTDVALTMIPRRLFHASIGALIGATPALAIFIEFPVSTPPDLALSGIAVTMLLAAAGATLGVAIACTTNIGPSKPELPRVARATCPRMSDYLSPAWVVSSIAVCTAGIAVAIVVLARNSANSTMNFLMIALTVISVLTLGLCPLLAQRLLTSPQPANDSLELAWDDAMRTHGLRSIWFAPLAVGVATALFAINLIYPNVPALAGFEYLLCIIGVSLRAQITRPGWRFQRRLWPRTPQPVVGSYAE